MPLTCDTPLLPSAFRDYLAPAAHPPPAMLHATPVATCLGVDFPRMERLPPTAVAPQMLPGWMNE